MLQSRRELPSTVPAVYAAKPPGSHPPQAACAVFIWFHLLGPVVDFGNCWRGQARLIGGWRLWACPLACRAPKPAPDGVSDGGVVRAARPLAIRGHRCVIRCG